MKKYFYLLCIVIFTSGCFKTAEQIKREKQVDQMKVQLDQSSKLVATLTQQVSSLQARLDSTSGQLEEIGYKTSSNQQETQDSFAQTTAQLAEQISILKNDVSSNKSSLRKIQKSLNAQQEYLNKLNTTLAKLTGVSSSTNSSSKKLLKSAHRAFEKNELNKAKELYEQILSVGKINASQRNHVWFNLGLLDYWAKRYNDSSVWFSKIFTKYPKSSWAPRSLLYIARCFKKLGQKEESQATYATLIKEYPNSKHAKKAKKEISE